MAETPLPPPSLGRQLTSNLDAMDESAAAAAALAAASGNGATMVADKMKRTYPNATLKLKFGQATDIGGGATNQDSGDIFEIPEEGAVVFAVYDGHGRELGELASQVARDSVRTSLRQPGVIGRVRVDAEEEFVAVFKRAHEDIRNAFRKFYQETGWEVQYLVKRKSASDAWTCTHGGTTATVVVVLDGWRMIVANVGDSTALWGGVDPEGLVVHRELSAEHSPENVEEFERVRKFRPSSTEPHNVPEMRFVYDAPSFSKSQCPPIFELNPQTGAIKVTGNGRYYKNVRSEWATLVTTPATARFQDALAFTRSLGDLHLHVYGVSCRPAVAEYDLVALHALVAGPPPAAPAAAATTAAASANPVFSVLLVCTDGVWDNWKFADIVAATATKEYTALSAEDANGQRATDKLLQNNVKRAHANFGSQSDNQTAVLCHLSFA